MPHERTRAAALWTPAGSYVYRKTFTTNITTPAGSNMCLAIAPRWGADAIGDFYLPIFHPSGVTPARAEAIPFNAHWTAVPFYIFKQSPADPSGVICL
jgi:hypothetical protein